MSNGASNLRYSLDVVTTKKLEILIEHILIIMIELFAPTTRITTAKLANLRNVQSIEHRRSQRGAPNEEKNIKVNFGL